MRSIVGFVILFIVFFLLAGPGLARAGDDLEPLLKPVPLDQGKDVLFKAYIAQFKSMYNRTTHENRLDDVELNEQCRYQANQEIASLPTSTGASWEQDVLDGMAAFLADRVKEELALTLVEHLKDSLCRVNSDQRYYLQTTCKVADDLKIGENPIYWSQIKSAFEKDLIQLPYRLIRKVEKSNKLQASSPPAISQEDARLIVQLALEIVINLQKGEDPLETLTGFSRLVGPDAYNCTTHKAICVLSLVSKMVEICGYHSSNPVVATDITDALIREISTFVKTNFEKEIDEEKLKILSRKFITLHDDIIEASKWAAQNAGKDGLGTFNRFARLTVKVLYFAKDIMSEIPDFHEGTLVKFSTGTKAADHGVTAMEYIRANDYQHCILETLMMVQVAVPAEKLPDWFKKYMPFVAEVASAQSSDDVKKALQNAAAPVGSYRIKRVLGKTTVAIGAAVGFIGGWEDMIHPENADSWAGGLFAPIGLTVDWGIGHCKCCKVDHSIGMMIPLIDLGTLVQYRFTSENKKVDDGDEDATVEQQPSYGFMHVLSPGLYLVYGIPTVPLIIGGGFSYAPGLRKVEQVNSGVDTNEDIMRYGVFLGFDIPIFPFTE